MVAATTLNQVVYSAEEAAVILRLSRNKIYREIKSQRLLAFDVSDEGSSLPRYRIPAAAIEAWLQGRLNVAPDERDLRLASVTTLVGGLQTRIAKIRAQQQADSVGGQNA